MRLAPPAAGWLLAGLLLLITGLLARRGDVAALAVAPLLAIAWSWVRRPRMRAGARLRLADQIPGSGRIAVTVEVTPGDGLVGLRLGAPGHRPAEALVVARRRVLAASMGTLRTGRREVLRIERRLFSDDQLLVGDPTRPDPLVVTVLPTTSPLTLAPLPTRLQGLTGPHGSRRAGSGGDLHDVAPFAPGDRLRRIDWRVTSRLNSGPPGGVPIRQLYVRRTFATAEALIMLVLDSRDQVGARISTWGDPGLLEESEYTSLDVARIAAASVARHYLQLGDRVGLDDLGRWRRPILPAGGRPHLQRLVHRLALTEPEGEPAQRRRVPRLPSGCLILLFSTLLDDEPAELARTWERAGHRVIVVDTLPRLVGDQVSDRMAVAYRVVAMERADRLRSLAAGGVEVVAWPSATDIAGPEAALAGLARRRPRR